METNIQKGLVNGISAAFEHTNHLAYVINNARKSQRSLIVTLLDLRNAFREVHHLEHHHVPDCIQEIVNNLYCCFKTYVLTDDFVTDLTHMKKFLQWDCFTPLVKHKKYEQFGYKLLTNLTPRHLYQLADDAPVISGLERENQIHRNLFSRWFPWADMIISVEKCHSFGIKRSGTGLNNSNQNYLGRHFD